LVETDLFDNRFDIWETSDIIRLRSPLVSNVSFNLVLSLALNIGVAGESQYEVLKEDGQGRRARFKKRSEEGSSEI